MSSGGDDRIAELRLAFAKLQDLLSNSRWPPILAEIATGLEHESSQQMAIERLKGYFGGMGSLNDVFLCASNNNVPAGRDEAEANKELGDVLDRIFALVFPEEARVSGFRFPPRILHAFRR